MVSQPDWNEFSPAVFMESHDAIFVSVLWDRSCVSRLGAFGIHRSCFQ